MSKLSCETVCEIQKAVRKELIFAPKIVRLEWAVGVLTGAVILMSVLNILIVLG